jgi:hypothetical protein
MENKYGKWSIGISIALLTLGIGFMLFMFCSCTLSYQNIITHGTASDLVDDNQTADPDITPSITIPVKP